MRQHDRELIEFLVARQRGETHPEQAKLRFKRAEALARESGLLKPSIPTMLQAALATIRGLRTTLNDVEPDDVVGLRIATPVTLATLSQRLQRAQMAVAQALAEVEHP